MNIKQMQQMMKQAQKMQDNMTGVKDEIDQKEFTEVVGGGIVSVTLLGTKKIQKIEINKEIMEPSEKEMLEDLIQMAINNAMDHIDKELEEKMGPLTNGLPF